eukprot:gene15377-13833_t
MCSLYPTSPDATLDEAKRVVTEREPVNIAMARSYNEAKLNA